MNDNGEITHNNNGKITTEDYSEVDLTERGSCVWIMILFFVVSFIWVFLLYEGISWLIEIIGG